MEKITTPIEEAEALLATQDAPETHRVFRAVLFQRDQLREELKRLKLYESEHERLKGELNRILHPGGGGPKAPSFCDLVAYVESDLKKARRT